MINSIDQLSDYELLEHFKDAVCDNNYNPSSTPYNQSKFSFEELEAEILKRMSNEKE